jgi:hypothetical protein
MAPGKTRLKQISRMAMPMIAAASLMRMAAFADIFTYWGVSTVAQTKNPRALNRHRD